MKFKAQQMQKIELKPWEEYNEKTYLSGWSLFKYYMVILSKIASSNMHYLCYFLMLVAVMTNGGLFYMPYPFMVFGVALLKEERPGKVFWYTVVFYTQFLMLLQYFA